MPSSVSETDAISRIVAPISTHPDSTLSRPWRYEGAHADWVGSTHAQHLRSRGRDSGSNGFAISDPAAGSRRRPDGTLLSWQIASVDDSTLTVAPFFIEWAADAPHPSGTTPSGCRLLDLHLVERQPRQLAQLLSTLGFRTHVDAGPAPRISFSSRVPGALFRLANDGGRSHEGRRLEAGCLTSA